jgi:type I restriction enzyme R subunit
VVPFLDKNKRKLVYTDFQDQVMGVREHEVVFMPKMTGALYEKRSGTT